MAFVWKTRWGWPRLGTGCSSFCLSCTLNSSTFTVSPRRQRGFWLSPTWAPGARVHKSLATPSGGNILDTSCLHSTLQSWTFGLLPSSQHSSLWELNFKTAQFFFPRHQVLALAQARSPVGKGPGPQTLLPAGGCGTGRATAGRHESTRHRSLPPALGAGHPAPREAGARLEFLPGKAVGDGSGVSPPGFQKVGW